MRVTVPVTLLTVFLTPNLAGGQSFVDMTSPFPRTVMRVCKSPEDAEIEAARAALLAKRPEPTTQPAIKKILVELRNEDCDLLYVSPLRVRLHAKIPAYETWAIIYDEGGNAAFKASLNGEEVQVPVSFRLQTVQIYEAVFRLKDGREITRWIELPANPYSIDYFNQKSPRK